MPKCEVCPACYHGDCDDCCGSGCYCDCQIPGGPRPELEDIFEDEQEEEFRRNGYA